MLVQHAGCAERGHVSRHLDFLLRENGAGVDLLDQAVDRDAEVARFVEQRVEGWHRAAMVGDAR